jgi:hypothetical protein
MKIALQRGQFLRVVNGAGSTVTAHNPEGDRIMKYLIFALTFATLAGCAQLGTQDDAAAGASAEKTYLPAQPFFVP